MEKTLRRVLVALVLFGSFAAFGQQPDPSQSPPPPPSEKPDKLDTLIKAADGIQGSINKVSDQVQASQNKLAQVQQLVSDLQTMTGSGFSDISGKASQIQQVLSGAVLSLNSLTATTKAVQSQVTQLQSSVGALHSELASVARSVSQLTLQVGANEAHRVTAQIEEQLRTSKYTLVLYATADQGGQLDLVRDIVNKGYSKTVASGQGSDWQWYLDNAKNHLDKAESHYQQGEYGKALNEYGKSYREIIKASKANPSS